MIEPASPTTLKTCIEAAEKIAKEKGFRIAILSQMFSTHTHDEHAVRITHAVFDMAPHETHGKRVQMHLKMSEMPGLESQFESMWSQREAARRLDI